MTQSKQFTGTKAYYRALKATRRSSRLPEQPACILELTVSMTHLQTSKELQSPPFALSAGQLHTTTLHSTSRDVVSDRSIQNKLTLRQPDPSGLNSDPRLREIYLNNIGGLLTLSLGQLPSGVLYSTLNALASVISALITSQGKRPGISKSRPQKTFTKGRHNLCAQS